MPSLGHTLKTDPRSNGVGFTSDFATLDQGSGWTYGAHQNNPALILLAFVGASPQNIYSFVSAINIQMRLNIKYSP
jgi:hypothetical protein